MDWLNQAWNAVAGTFVAGVSLVVETAAPIALTLCAYLSLTGDVYHPPVTDVPTSGAGEQKSPVSLPLNFPISFNLPLTSAFENDLAQAKTDRKPGNGENRYWTASIIGGQIVKGIALSFTEARLEASLYHNILCKDSNAARAIAVRFPGNVGPEIGNGGKDGFLWHYHVNRSTHAHIWYYGT